MAESTGVELQLDNVGIGVTENKIHWLMFIHTYCVPQANTCNSWWLILINKRQRKLNRQSRDTSNNGYTRHRMKTNKTKNTTQKTKEVRNTDSRKNHMIN